MPGYLAGPKGHGSPLGSLVRFRAKEAPVFNGFVVRVRAPPAAIHIRLTDVEDASVEPQGTWVSPIQLRIDTVTVMHFFHWR